MQAKQYLKPGGLSDALFALHQAGSTVRPLAGGTDIIIQVRENRRPVDTLVDLKAIPELTSISRADDGGLLLGAAVSCSSIYQTPGLRESYPALVDSASLIGGVQIQHRASIGGNLCNASPAADSIPSLIVLNATCIIAGPNGRRELPVSQFCTGPGTNALLPGEMLLALRFPPPAKHSGSAYLRFIPRNEMDIAVAGAGAWVVLDERGETITGARIGLGAVAPTPLSVETAAQALIGKPANAETFALAAREASAAANPITDMRGSAAQRRHLAGVLTRRALSRAAARAREEIRS